MQHRNVIKAAKQAGVRWIVYTSILRADTSTISLAEEHRDTETALKESGIPCTLLRNGWYNENYANAITGAVASSAVIGSVGEGKISGAAREDYAEAAAAVLTGPGHQGKTYELAGDTSFTLTELAEEISRSIGRSITYKYLPEAEYAATLTSFGMPDWLGKAIAGWDVGASRGDLFDDSKQLSALIGHPTAPISEVIARVVKSE